jgi:hypothetical protein
MSGPIARRLLVGLFCLSVLAPATLRADEWNYRLTPYLWATSLKGKTSIGPIGGDIDMDFGDILSDLQFALMLNFRAQKGRWAIQADGVWADLESSVSRNISKTTVGTTMWIASLNGRYRFADDWEVLAGARYFRQDVDISVLVGSTTAKASATADWIDPVVGAAYSTSLSDKWSVQVQGDIGGFGIGSDFTWHAFAGVDYRMSKGSSLALGWRHLDWDYEEGSGAKRFTYDAYLTGPLIGVSFLF